MKCIVKCLVLIITLTVERYYFYSKSAISDYQENNLIFLESSPSARHAIELYSCRVLPDEVLQIIKPLPSTT